MATKEIGDHPRKYPSTGDLKKQTPQVNIYHHKFNALG